MSSTSTFEKSYMIATGRIYDLSLDDGSETEEGQAVIRFAPYLWVNHTSPTEVYVPPKFSMTIMSGERETVGRAAQAAGMTSDFLTNTATDFSESATLRLENYASLESVLEYHELFIQKILTTWQESARAKGLNWNWVEKHCSSVEPHDFHSSMLKRAFLDDSYGMLLEQPITLKPEGGVPTGITRPSLSGIDLGDSPDTERLYLYPIIRKSYVARYETIFRGTIQSDDPANNTGANDLQSIYSLARSWELNIGEAAENFSRDFAVTVLPQETQAPESEAGVSTDMIKSVTHREITSIGKSANVQELLDQMDKNVEEVLETWRDSALKRGMTWAWNTGSCPSKPPTWRQDLLLKTQMKDSYAIWRESPITLKAEAVTPSTTCDITSTLTRAGLARIPLSRSPDTERLWLYSIMRRTLSSRSDPGADADAEVDQAQGMLHFFAIPATHLESRAPWAEHYVPQYRPKLDPSLPRVRPDIYKEIGYLLKTCYGWEKLVKQSAEAFASEFMVKIVPEGDETQPDRFFVPAFSRGPG